MKATMTPAAQAALDILIDSLKLHIQTNTEELAKLKAAPPLEQGYIVLSGHGIAVRYEMVGTTRVVKPTSILKAPRFRMGTADVMANVTHDGTGKPFRSMHVTEALRERIEADAALLGELVVMAEARERQPTDTNPKVDA